jgi:ABC-2 type transport system ATP-binding protein
MPVLQTLVYMGMLQRMRRSEARSAAMQWLERLALQERAGDKLDALSKGNQQKIQFISGPVGIPNDVWQRAESCRAGTLVVRVVGSSRVRQS